MRGLLEVAVAILTGVAGQLLAKFLHLDEARKQTAILEEIRDSLNPKG